MRTRSKRPGMALAKDTFWPGVCAFVQSFTLFLSQAEKIRKCAHDTGCLYFARPFGIHGGQVGSFASRAWNTQLMSYSPQPHARVSTALSKCFFAPSRSPSASFVMAML